MKKLALTLLLLFLVALGLLFAALDEQPLVKREAGISSSAVAQARSLLLSNDPRKLQAGEERRALIPTPLLDTGLNSLVHHYLQGSGAFITSEETAEVQISLRTPLLQRYVNLRATLREATGEPYLISASIGSLPLPSWLVEWLLAAGIRQAGFEREGEMLRQSILALEFNPGQQQLVVSYRWDPALLERARSLAINPQELLHIRQAHAKLAKLLEQQPMNSEVGLTRILRELLNDNTPNRLENRRAALLALAAYLSERNLADLIPEAQDWPITRPVSLVLRQRHDSAQHFVISAALVAWSGQPMASAIGVYKEILDSQEGSGFSFPDLAADRAGSRFGEAIKRNAAHLDSFLASEFSDSEIAPILSDLPDNLSQKEFISRFGGMDSEAYQELMNEIEQRLDRLPLYQ